MKAHLLRLVLFTLWAATAEAVDLGEQVASTPYDRYMGEVKSVLGQLSGSESDVEKVCSLMQEGHKFRYRFTRPYKSASPEETQLRREGDCKAKALWLCSRMNDAGLRYVVGKTKLGAPLSHAWLLWWNDGYWWILDCTNLSVPLRADLVPSDEYVPFYSWNKSGEYQHNAAPTAIIAVANKRSASASR